MNFDYAEYCREVESGARREISREFAVAVIEEEWRRRRTAHLAWQWWLCSAHQRFEDCMNAHADAEEND